MKRSKLSVAIQLSLCGAMFSGTVAAQTFLNSTPAFVGGADNPQSIFAIDVDGDGDTDVLSASQDDSTIYWFENRGHTAGTFFRNTISTTANGASSVFAADMDGDGDIDVLSASRYDNKIAWYENDGELNPGFTLQTISVAASGASSVFAADVNGDGHVDVLSASRSDNKITWFENNGASDPGFTLHTISTAAMGATSVFAADVDGDGDTDVLSASENDDKIAWYENQGLTFTLRTISTSADFAKSVFAADLDGDGDTDVLSASRDDNKIAWYENDGMPDPDFSLHTISTSATGAYSVFAAKIDNNDNFDVLSASRDDNKIAWYFNNGSGSFIQQTIDTGAPGAGSVFAADLDGDGDNDVLYASQTEDRIEWKKNRSRRIEPQFQRNTVSTTANGAFSVFAADREGDGDIDVLSGAYFNGVAWQVNNGDGSYTLHTVSTEFGVRSVFATDVDGDGDTDVLSASSYGDRIAWFELNNDLTYTLHTISTAADGAYSVYAADVDGDGDVDVLSASNDDDKISWYKNDGSQNFTEITISTTALGAFSVFAADVDGDGDIDVLSASSKGADNKVAWYENNGAVNPGFTLRTISTRAEGPRSVFAADVDGDGDTDVLSAGYANGLGAIRWFRNNNNNFPVSGTGFGIGFLSPAWSVFAADVDGDGDTDVLGAGGTKVYLYENDGTGFQFNRVTLSESLGFAQSVYAADVDGDGDLDALSASFIDDQVNLYENLANHRSAAFDGTRPISFDAIYASAVFAADVDGDGFTDVLSASYDDDKIAWYKNDSAGGFALHTISTSAEAAFSVFAADMDSDGDTDVLSASIYDNKIAWYQNDGSESFTLRTISTTAYSAASVFAADLDGDGDTDVLSASVDDNKIAWYENNGALTPVFTLHTISTTAYGAGSVFAADVDGDGHIDVLSASLDDNKIAWYENNGASDPGFTLHTISLTADAASSVFATDMDGDGDTDVLSASIEDDKIAWYQNDGSESFTLRTISTTAIGAYSAIAADLDGDGDIDVMSASLNDQKIAWYENDGGLDPVFTLRTISTTADGASSVFAADVDGDGDTDVLSASGYDDKIAWFENCGGQFAITGEAAGPVTIFDGQAARALTVDFVHNGRSGDFATIIDSLALQFLDSAGNPLNTAQANGLIDSVRIYKDEGNGVFDGFETVIGTQSDLSVTPVALTRGVQKISSTAAGIQNPGDSVRLFIVPQLTESAASQATNANPGEFQIALHLKPLPRTQARSGAPTFVALQSQECGRNTLSGVITATGIKIFSNSFEGTGS